MLLKTCPEEVRFVPGLRSIFNHNDRRERMTWVGVNRTYVFSFAIATATSCDRRWAALDTCSDLQERLSTYHSHQRAERSLWGWGMVSLTVRVSCGFKWKLKGWAVAVAS